MAKPKAIKPHRDRWEEGYAALSKFRRLRGTVARRDIMSKAISSLAHGYPPNATAKTLYLLSASGGWTRQDLYGIGETIVGNKVLRLF
jgi:hypothetical protein